MRALSATPPLRTEWIRSDASRVPSFFPLLPRIENEFLRGFHVVEREIAGFDQPGHYRLRTAAEKAQQIIDEFALCGLTGHRRFKNVGIRNLPYPTHRLFSLKAIDGGLDGGISGSGIRREALLDFPNGDTSSLP